jgi:hypothetical protein
MKLPAPGRALLLALAALGCASPSGDAAPPAERPAWVDAARDLGQTGDDAYVHDGLGLRVALPEGWLFLTREQIDQVETQGYGEMAREDEKLALEAEAASEITSVLFVMVDVDSLRGATPVPTLIATLEPIDPRLLRPAPIDYARSFRERFEQSEAKIRFESEAEPAPLGGAPAARVVATSEGPAGALRQTFWFCVRGRLLFTLIASLPEESQRPRLEQALAQLRFAGP